ncbi:MAG TPA: glycosyltransferase family 39 protein [Myxococcota bacterium]|nr:glycosyltransferase family 39 protein [Myxococcota bacterium]
MSRARLWLVLALFGAIAAGLTVKLGHDKMWRSSEERCVQVVTGMLDSGDWLVPRIDGTPRLQKPPLFYWAGAAVAEVSGARVLIALRATSVLAALALAAAVFAVGFSLGQLSGALASLLSLGATALFYLRGRTGDAEMLLALFVFLALAAFERLYATRDRRLLPALATCVGLAFLAKATAALLCILAPIAVWLAWERRLSLALRPAVLGWALLALAISLSWYALILARVPDAQQLFQEYLIGPLGMHASGRDATHLRSFGYYWPRYLLNAAPASVALLWAAWEGWQTRFWRDDPRLRFYAVAALSQITAWSFVPSKQIHYLLPMVPLQAVWIGGLVARRYGALAARTRSYSAASSDGGHFRS